MIQFLIVVSFLRWIAQNTECVERHRESIESIIKIGCDHAVSVDAEAHRRH